MMKLTTFAMLLGLLATCTLAVAEDAKGQWVYRDGQYFYETKGGKPLTPIQQTPKQPTTPKPTTTALTAYLAGKSVVENIAMVYGWHEEGKRLAEARRQAEERAVGALEKSADNFAVVPFFSEKPFRPPTETNKSVDVHTYSIGTASTHPDMRTLARSVFGPLQPAISEPGQGATSQSKGSLRGIVLAEKKGDGSIQVRSLGKSDEQQHIKNEFEDLSARNKEEQARLGEERKRSQATLDQFNKEQRKQEEADAALQEKLRAEIEALQKQKSAELQKELDKREEERRRLIAEGKKREEEKRKREAEAKVAQERIEKQQREVAERERKQREAYEALQRSNAEVAATCKTGNRAACILAIDKETNEFNKALTFQRTARCAIETEPGNAPKGGPCAPDAPPCMYCSAGASLERHSHWEAFVAAQVGTRAAFLTIGASDATEKKIAAKLSAIGSSQAFRSNPFFPNNK